MNYTEAWIKKIVQRSMEKTIAAMAREKAAEKPVAATETVQKAQPVATQKAVELPKKLMVFASGAAEQGHGAIASLVVLAPMGTEPKEFVTKELPRLSAGVAKAAGMTKDQICLAHCGQTALDGVWDSSRANNRAAVCALIEADAVKVANVKAVEFYTDSTWIANAVGSWVARWAKNGWLTSTGVTPRDVDTWKLYVSTVPEEFRKGLKVIVFGKSPAQAACKNRAYLIAHRAAESAKGAAAIESIEAAVADDSKELDKLEKELQEGFEAATKVVVDNSVIA